MGGVLGVCCSSRDKIECNEGNDNTNNSYSSLPHAKKEQFNAELSKAVNKEDLKNNVLSHQEVLDFESYKSVMGLVSAYVFELTLQRNQNSFTTRQSLLKQISEN